MMKLTVNNKVIEFTGKTITDLLQHQKKDLNGGYAVAVNDSIILKSQWGLFQLNEADLIHIIIPAEGG